MVCYLSLLNATVVLYAYLMASFAEDYGPYEHGNNIRWFESEDNIPFVTSKISDCLGMDDTNTVSYTHLTLPTNREV